MADDRDKRFLNPLRAVQEPEDLDRLALDVLRFFTMGQPRLEIKDFIGKRDGDSRYSKEAIRQDERRLEETKGEIEQTEREGREKNDVMEQVFVHLAEPNNWLGNDMIIFQTTEFDDITKGVDAVAIPTMFEEERFGLGIDTSVSQIQATIERKIRINFAKMKAAKDRNPIQIKYFQSEDEEYHGPLQVIPVVIGIGRSSLKNLLEQYKQIKTLQDKVREHPNLRPSLRTKIQEMENNPIQILLLEEIRVQLQKYARLVDHDLEKKQMATQIFKLQEIINGLLEEKSTIKVPEALRQDPTYNHILAATSKL